MTEDEIVYLINAHYATSGEINDVIIFARAIEHCTLTKQKAKWYQEGVEAGLRQALAEPPNYTTDVVEPEEPLCYLQEIDTLGGAYEQVAWGEGFPVYTAPQNMDVEIKRLQELADYRLKLLTKMPSEWVGLTDEELTNIRDFYIDDSGHVDLPETFARAIEARIKELNT